MIINNKMATTKTVRTFKDLDLNFTAHPVTGDVTRRYDDEAIKRSIRNLLLTSNYERPFHSEIGCQIRSMLFEPVTPMLTAAMKRIIVDTISTFEPRAVLNDVTVTINPDNNAAYVSVLFTIVNTFSPVKLDVVIERTR
jgi:phage baseplate assembly protein W